MASTSLPFQSSSSSSSPLLPPPPSHPPSASSDLPSKYDVFLSFRGQDVRTNFIDHLDAALRQNGIVTFKDDRELERGNPIVEGIEKAIKHSRSSIVVFSRNYAASTWCMDELVMINERMKQESSYKVFPVFYHVDSTDVQELGGSYGEAFAKHEQEFRNEMLKVMKWKVALIEVAQVSGWDLQNKPEFKFIQEIAQMVLNRLGKPKGINPIGIVDERQEVVLDGLEKRKASHPSKCDHILISFVAIIFIICSIAFLIGFLNTVSHFHNN